MFANELIADRTKAALFDCARRVMRALLGGFAVVGCSEPTSLDYSRAQLTVHPREIVLGSLGATTKLSVEVTDGSGRRLQVKPAWVTLDSGIVRVDRDGRVTAVGRGTASVVAVLGERADTATIRVVQVPWAFDLSGDGQRGQVSSALPRRIGVRVTDAGGSPVPSLAVVFNAIAGGSVSDSLVLTDVDGRASTRWVLGSERGDQHSVIASIGDSLVRFSATAISVEIDSVIPEILVRGDTATIFGTDLVSPEANHRVVLDGQSLPVVRTAGESVQFVVPSVCRAEQSTTLRAITDGVPSSALSIKVRPREFIKISPGHSLELQVDSSACVNWKDEEASAEYLVALRRAPSFGEPSLIYEVRGHASAAPTSTIVRQGISTRQSNLASSRYSRHRGIEQLIHQRSSAPLRVNSSRSNLSQDVAAIPVEYSLGDTISNFRLWDQTSACTGYREVSAVVKALSDDVLLVEDLSNEPGWSHSQYAQLAEFVDEVATGAVGDFVGPVSDLDMNGRVVVVVSRKVSETTPGLLAYVAGCDFLSRVSAPASNQGEHIYLAPPDSKVSADSAFRLAHVLLVHELAHVVQLGVRVGRSAGLMSEWESEGQALLIEEEVGHRLANRQGGSDYGPEAVGSFDERGIRWYVNLFEALVDFFESDGGCTWLDTLQSTSCDTRSHAYGGGWSLLRWLADQYATECCGSTQNLSRRLVESSLSGLPNLASVVGVTADSLLRSWSVAIAVDDFVALDVDDSDFPSWKLGEIFPWDSSGRRGRRRTFEPFVDVFELAPGNSVYWTIFSQDQKQLALEVVRRIEGGLFAPLEMIVVRLRD